MLVTEILSNEHRVIEQMLDCLDHWVDDSEATGHCDWPTAGRILDFLNSFADGCHHGKEEEKLFPMMEAHGFSKQMGPTAVMRSEHEQGRRYMAQMTSAVEQGPRGNASALSKFAEAAKAYGAMLRTHIQKEDHCLFPMAEQALTEFEKIELMRQFEVTEHRPDLEGEHEKYLRFAHDLAQRYGVKRVKSCELHHVPCCGHA